MYLVCHMILKYVKYCIILFKILSLLNLVPSKAMRSGNSFKLWYNFGGKSIIKSWIFRYIFDSLSKDESLSTVQNLENSGIIFDIFGLILAILLLFEAYFEYFWSKILKKKSRNQGNYTGLVSIVEKPVRTKYRESPKGRKFPANAWP